MDRSELAREWSDALAQIVYVARSRDEVEGELADCLGELTDALRGEPFSADEPGAAVGTRLVRLGLTESECVRCCVDVLGRRLPLLPELAEVEQLTDKVLSLLGVLAVGFTDGIRSRLLDEQEGLTRALIRARENAEQATLASEARFEQVFATSSVGMAISEPDGPLVRINQALADILGYDHEALAARRLDDLFHPHDAEYLRLRYDVLRSGEALPFRERRRLVRANGEDAVVFLSASVLRNTDGSIRYFVTSAEDISDKHLLEGQLRFQSTHDALTGLPNRQAFVGRLEELLAGTRSAEAVTVFHLNLDGFHTINDGLGRHVGDLLLQAVANRLNQVFTGEKVTVARFDGDEFGVLLEHAPTTPSVETIAVRINEELSEPVYVGDEGIAATASIAVLQRPAADTSPADLLRATDLTLHRLKAAGRRQWDLVDPAANERDTARYSLASSMPGAWESGDIDIEYQPLVAVDRGAVVAVQAMLRWDHATLGSLDHGQCLRVLAETGLSLPVGRWMLGRAAEQLKSWTDRFDAGSPKLYVELTRDLAGDPDLVATVRAVLADAGLSASQLMLAMPVRALCQDDGQAEDNLDVVADLGVGAVLYEFGTTRGDLACLEDLPVRTVKMAERVGTRVARRSGTGSTESLFTRAIRELVPLVRQNGYSVIVGGVDDEREHRWWREVGVDLVQGSLTGPAGSPRAAEELFVA